MQLTDGDYKQQLCGVRMIRSGASNQFSQ